MFLNENIRKSEQRIDSTRYIMDSIKRILVWSIPLLMLDYPKIFTLNLHICLFFIYHEYADIFNKICNTQTGSKEEKYISNLSNSIFPYILIQGFLFTASLSTENPERILCMSLLLSTIIMIGIRIHQYSGFCVEATNEKREKQKEKRVKKDDDK